MRLMVSQQNQCSMYLRAITHMATIPNAAVKESKTGEPLAPKARNGDWMDAMKDSKSGISGFPT